MGIDRWSVASHENHIAWRHIKMHFNFSKTRTRTASRFFVTSYCGSVLILVHVVPKRGFLLPKLSKFRRIVQFESTDSVTIYVNCIFRFGFLVFAICSLNWLSEKFWNLWSYRFFFQNLMQSGIYRINHSFVLKWTAWKFLWLFRYIGEDILLTDDDSNVMTYRSSRFPRRTRFSHWKVKHNPFSGPQHSAYHKYQHPPMQNVRNRESPDALATNFRLRTSHFSKFFVALFVRFRRGFFHAFFRHSPLFPAVCRGYYKSCSSILRSLVFFECFFLHYSSAIRPFSSFTFYFVRLKIYVYKYLAKRDLRLAVRTLLICVCMLFFRRFIELYSILFKSFWYEWIVVCSVRSLDCNFSILNKIFI